jgi:hypothetical protein
MGTKINLIFDGNVFLPEDPVNLKPNTHILATIEQITPPRNKKDSFIHTAVNIKLEGPEDWSERLEEYLYGTSHNAS